VNSTELLVIILSISMILFLIIGVALFVYLIVLTRQIRRITRTAEKAVDDIESITSGVAKIISPAYALNLLSGFVKKFKNKGGRNVKE